MPPTVTRTVATVVVALLTVLAPVIGGIAIPGGVGTAAGDSTLVVDDDGGGDYTSIQAAVDDASAGDVIEVRAGTYNESVRVDLTVTIRGPKATLDGSGLNDSAGIVIRGGDPTITGLTIRGYEFDGVLAFNGGFTLDRVTAVDNGQSGVDVFNVDDDWTITGATLDGNGNDGLVVTDATGTWRVESTTIRNNGDDGIDVDRENTTAGTWTIVDATVTDNGQNGVEAIGTSADWTIRGGRFANNSDDGLDVAGSTGAWTITGVRVDSNGNNGVEAEFTTGDWRLADAEITNSGEHGVTANASTGNWTVRNAVIDGAGGAGLRATRTGGAWRARNLTVTDAIYGIDALGAGGNWVVEGLRIRAVGVGIRASVAGGDWQVRDATVDAATAGIAAFGAGGNWTVRNATMAVDGRFGVYAGDSDGAWSLTDTTVRDADTSVYAGRAGGNWTIRDSVLRNYTVGVNATNTTGAWDVETAVLDSTRANTTDIVGGEGGPTGDATRNWWGGTTDAPDPADCEGNVDCSNPLEEPPAFARDRGPLSVTAARTTIAPTGTAELSVTVENTGVEMLRNVTVDVPDSPGDGLLVRTGDAGAGEWRFEIGERVDHGSVPTARWGIDELAPGERATFTLDLELSDVAAPFPGFGAFPIGLVSRVDGGAPTDRPVSVEVVEPTEGLALSAIPGQSFAVELPPGVVRPGVRIPVAFSITNRRTDPADVTLTLTSLPDGWTVTDYGAYGGRRGTWDEAGGVWTLSGLDTGRASPRILLRPPEGTAPGNYTVGARLEGDGGTVVTDTATVRVVRDGIGGRNDTGGAGEPPTAVVEPNRTIENGTVTIAPGSVTFDASGSSDPDGSVAAYRWDLDGDGTVDRRGRRIAVRYDRPGDYSVTLIVVDDSGRRASTSQSVSVSVSPEEPDGNVEADLTVGAESISLAAGQTAVLELTVENTGSEAVSNVGVNLGRGLFPVDLEIVEYRGAGGTWDRAANNWSTASLAAGETATPSVTVRLTEPDASDTYTIPLAATAGGKTAATGSTRIEVLPVFNGLFPPRVDGQLRPDEYREGYGEQVRFSTAGGKTLGNVLVKTLDDHLYLALRVNSKAEWFEPTGERFRVMRVRLDRDGSGSISEGDVRVTATRLRNLGGSLFAIGSVAVYRDGVFVPVEFEGVPSPSVTASFAGAPGSGITGPAVIEAGIPTGAIDDALDDPAADPSGERIGVGVTIEVAPSGGGGTATYRMGEAFGGSTGGTYPLRGVDLPREAWVPETDAEKIDLEVDHVEITQAVQRPDNSLATVRGKTTLARAFVRHNITTVAEGEPTPVTVVFQAWNTSGVTARYLGTETVDYRAPAVPVRRVKGGSANLVLPHDWTTHEQLALKVSVYPKNRIDTSAGDDVLVESKGFVETYDLVIYEPFVNEAPQGVSVPPESDRRRMNAVFEATFPVADPVFVDLPWRAVGGRFPDLNVRGRTGERERNRLIRELNELRRTLSTRLGRRAVPGVSRGRSPPDQLYGITDYSGGLSDPAWFGGESFVSFGGLPGPMTMPHEINHNLGNDNWGRHVADSSQGYGCGAPGPDPQWNRLFDTDDINAVGWNATSGAIVPPGTPDLMTYCVPRWISAYRWTRLVERLKTFEPETPTHPDLQSIARDGPGTLSRPRSLSLPASNRTVLGEPVATIRFVSGSLTRNGSGRLAVSFERPGRFARADRPGTAANATAVVRVTRANGSTTTVPVRARFVTVEGGRTPRAYFSVAIPDNGTIRRIELVNASTGRVLDSRVAADWTITNATIDTPVGFGRNAPTEVGIDVDAANVSEDRLRYKLLYSPTPESGVWYPYAGTFTGDSVTASFTRLPGNTTARFLLLISDGVRTAFVTSDPFAVPALGPTVSIDRGGPGNGTARINASAGGTVSLDASAQTQSGARLAGGRVRWVATDANGTVVATDTGTFEHQFEDPGVYRIEVTAIDPSTGLTATDTVRIDVGELSTPDNATVAAFEAGIDASLASGPSVPTLPGGRGPPTNVDGDALLEDTNGDGRFDILDVALLLETFDSEPVRNNSARFNFDGSTDGDVTIIDVAELLAEV